jgi:hypothetical protein
LRWTHGLSRHTYGRLEVAQTKTAWGRRRRQRVALLKGDADVLASATRYHFAGVLDRRPVRVCAIGEVIADTRRGADDHARSLIEWLVADGTQNGADVGLLFSDVASLGRIPDGFEPIPSPDVTLAVAQSPRHGAPIALIRGDEPCDYQAILAMGQVRAAPFRFHLDRDIDLLESIPPRLFDCLARQNHLAPSKRGNCFENITSTVIPMVAAASAQKRSHTDGSRRRADWVPLA